MLSRLTSSGWRLQWALALLVLAGVGLSVSVDWSPRGSGGAAPLLSMPSSATAPTLRGRELRLELDSSQPNQGWPAVTRAVVGHGPVDVLSVTGFGAGSLGDAGVRSLVELAPELAPKRLHLVAVGLTSVGLDTLLTSPLVSRLRVLNLRDNLLGPAGARRLAAASLPELEELNLARNHLHASGTQALAAAPGLGRLARLHLGYNFIGPAGARALANSRAWPELSHLGLAYNYLEDSGAQALAQQRWPKLTMLDLRSNEVSDPGLTPLGAMLSHAPSLTIWLAHNAITNERQLTGADARLRLAGVPTLEGQPLEGDDAFSISQHPTWQAHQAPPAGLPSVVEFREVWIWEFGLVGEFPTFMIPQARWGNGKGRDFAWLNRARMTLGGGWLVLPDTFAEDLTREQQALGEGVSVERLKKNAAVLRKVGSQWVRFLRLEHAHGARLTISFEYERGLAAYFEPIAERVVHSLYFDRAHLED